MRDERLLFYECVGQFKNQFYKDLLTIEHLIPQQISLKKLRFPDGTEDDEANFWGFELVKNNVSYLISSTDSRGKEINIVDMLPIKPSDVQKVAEPRGKVYLWVRKPISARFKTEKKHTPKEFIDTLSMLEHSSPDQQKLMWMMALSQLWDRSYYRISTPAGFGKDSTVDIANSLFGDCGTIESPTIAKLEDRASVLKWLVVNEVVDIGKNEWDVIQQFLLAAGAHKNEVTKHSRAFQNVKEIIDMSKFSLSLFYNDIDHYPDTRKYFDFVSKRAVKDRFPAFRFYGRYTQDFNKMRHENVYNFVRNNLDFYKDLLYSFTYYSKNYHEYIHKYDQSKLMKLTGRHSTNLQRLLKIVDFYSESQEEFDSWLEVINKSLIDYREMLDFASYKEQYDKKVGPETSYKDLQDLNKYDTFTQKNKFLKKLLSGERVYRDTKELWDYGKPNQEDDIL